jgi:hypothetical protein
MCRLSAENDNLVAALTVRPGEHCTDLTGTTWNDYFHVFIHTEAPPLDQPSPPVAPEANTPATPRRRAAQQHPSKSTDQSR